jgi:DsrE/DsrF-like family
VRDSKIYDEEKYMTEAGTVILVTRNGMGDAEQELQHKLITTYLTLLDDHDILPGAICFYTRGVQLVVDGSPVLEILGSLEKKGVHLILCSTCLNYYNLADKVRVGIVGGMGDILEAQYRADKVITL